MRFLTGIITGAAIVLLVATLADGGGWSARVPALFDRLAQAAGDALDLPPRPGALTPVMPQRLPAAAEQPAAEPIPQPPDPAPMDLSPPEDTQRLASEIFEQPAAVVSDAAAASGAAPSERQVPMLAAASLDPGPPEPAEPAPAQASGEQSVWAPFHSERSAHGFAERLSESLDHPFRVERRGPGRYQVVFAYHDEPQRDALLSSAAAVTGLPL